MSTTELPAQLLVQIDDAALEAAMVRIWGTTPPTNQPAPVAGAVISYYSNRFNPGHSIPAGTTWLDSPHLLKVTPKSLTSRFVIEFQGRFGASELSIVSLALKRDATVLPLPSGADGIDSPRIDLGADSTYLGSFKVEDIPNTTNEVTYRVVAKNRNGTGYFGRRGFDTIMNTPLFMAVTEYAS